MSTRPRITHSVVRELEDIRRSGVVDIFDRNAVAVAAHMIGADDLATFAATRPKDYADLVRFGPDAFEVVEEQGVEVAP